MAEIILDKVSKTFASENGDGRASAVVALESVDLTIRSEEIVCVVRHASEDPHGWRLRAMIVMLWRGGLRVTEALALSERDLDPHRGSVLVRCGKGGRRREVGMDGWGWENLRPWLSERLELPAGPLFCVIDGPTRGRPWSAAAVRTEFRRHAAEAGVRRRFAPH